LTIRIGAGRFGADAGAHLLVGNVAERGREETTGLLFESLGALAQPAAPHQTADGLEIHTDEAGGVAAATAAGP